MGFFITYSCLRGEWKFSLGTLDGRLIICSNTHTPKSTLQSERQLEPSEPCGALAAVSSQVVERSCWALPTIFSILSIAVKSIEYKIFFGGFKFKYNTTVLNAIVPRIYCTYLQVTHLHPYYKTISNIISIHTCTTVYAVISE